MPKRPATDENPPFSHLAAEDLQALDSLRRSNDWLRAVLCTLARRGVAFRKQQPDRAREILMVLAPLPYFKAGQFLFDLMEWEDFMIEGPQPPVVTTVLDASTLKRVASLLNVIKTGIDGGKGQADGADASPYPFGNLLKMEITALIVDDNKLPPLEAGFYLYRDVVLGVYVSALRSGQSAASMVPPPVTRPGEAAARNELSSDKGEGKPGRRAKRPTH